MPHPVLDAATRFRRQILARERQAANRLVQAYGRAYRRLGDSIDALEEAIVANAGAMTEADVTRLASLRSLRAQVVDEIERFAVFADQEISQSATAAIEAGLRDSQALVAEHFPRDIRPAVMARWDMLPAESVETMIGFLEENSPLHQALVGRLGEAVATRMADHLVDAIATGLNPREVARLVRRELGVGLTWALSTARTSMLWSYREASRASYIANRDIVDGWVWHSTLDSRVCMGCLAQHGTRHSVNEVLNGHHQCRCVAIPLVPLARQLGIAPPTIETGEQWFSRQPVAAQRQQMGPAMFEAWRAGEFLFSDLAQPYQDRVYGDMLGEATLVQLLGDRARNYLR